MFINSVKQNTLMISGCTKQLLTLDFTSNKVKSLAVFLAIVFYNFLPAKVIESDRKDSLYVSATDNVIIFNAEDSSANKKFNLEKLIVRNRDTEIFTADSIELYNNRASGNFKIKKTETRVIFSEYIKIFKEPEDNKSKVKSFRQSLSASYYSSKQNSERISQSEKEKVVLSPCRVLSVSKTINYSVKLLHNLFLFAEKQVFIYNNPNIKVHYFSGKYSVRPPTFHKSI